MFRPLRSTAALRPALRPLHLQNVGQFRAASTSAPVKGRGVKSTLARLFLVTGGLYYASTTDYFSEAAQNTYSQRRKELHARNREVKGVEEEEDDAPRDVDLKKLVREARAKEEEVKEEVEKTVGGKSTPEGSPEELEEEAGQQGAFNPETGEINWDCPCLGGMAHGPCGPQFRDAFSCFVYSTEEPKGVECIEKFKAMQDCFRLHPEVYGEELQSEDEEEAEIDEKLDAMEKNRHDALEEGEKKEGPVSSVVRHEARDQHQARGIVDKEEAVNATESYTVTDSIEPKIKELETESEGKIPKAATQSTHNTQKEGPPPKKDDIPVEEHKNT